MKLKTICEIIALVAGLSAVVMATYCLIRFNNIVIYEPNNFVRYSEIVWSIFSIYFLSRMIVSRIKD